MDIGRDLKNFFAYTLPIFGFFLFIFYFTSKNYVHVDLNRNPASVEGTCKQLVGSLIGDEFLPSKAWKNLTNIPKNYPFNYEEFKMLRLGYSEELATKPVKDIELKKTPEGILALAEAMNKRMGEEVDSGLDQSLQNMSFLKRRKLSRLVEKFDTANKRSMEDIEELVGNIYVAALGPRFKVSHALSTEKSKAKIMSRIVQEEMLTMGLTEYFGKHNALKSSKGFLRRFMDSYKGKSLATMLLNLPVMYGFPPMYLPGLKKITLPKALAQEILEKGLTDELVQKINIEVLQELKVKLPNRVRYEVVRRYLMAGMGIYLTYVILDEFYEGEQVRQQNELLEEVAMDMNDILSQAEALEDRGINIFNDDEDDVTADLEETGQLTDNPFCRAIRECLTMHKEETGEEAVGGSDSYRECKAFMDPDNKCPKL